MQMEQSSKESGSNPKCMASVTPTGQAETLIRETSLIINSKALVSKSLQTEVSSEENGVTTRKMDMAYTLGKAVKNMKVSGKMIKCMEEPFFIKLTVMFINVFTQTIKKLHLKKSKRRTKNKSLVSLERNTKFIVL